MFKKKTWNHENENNKNQKHYAIKIDNQYENMQSLNTIIIHYKFQNFQHLRQLMIDSLANLHFFKFYIFIVHFRIRFSKKYLRYDNINKSWILNDRIVFFLNNIYFQIFDYILFDENWKINYSRDQIQKSLMFFEINTYYNWMSSHDNYSYKIRKFYHNYRENDISHYVEFHVMIIVWKTIIMNENKIKIVEKTNLNKILKSTFKNFLKKKICVKRNNACVNSNFMWKSIKFRK